VSNRLFCYPCLGNVDFTFSMSVSTLLYLASWLFFYKTDASIHNVFLKKPSNADGELASISILMIGQSMCKDVS
jgi:hypothetical protein